MRRIYRTSNLFLLLLSLTILVSLFSGCHSTNGKESKNSETNTNSDVADTGNENEIGSKGKYLVKKCTYEFYEDGDNSDRVEIYDENGNIIAESYCGYDYHINPFDGRTDDGYVSEWMSFYEYDEHGNWVSDTTRDLPDGDVTITNYKTTSISENESEVISFQNDKENVKWNNKLDDRGNIVQKTLYNFTEGHFEPDGQYRYEYDENSVMAKESGYYFSEKDNGFVLKYEREYDGHGNIVKEAEYSDYDVNYAEIIEYSNEYDDNNNLKRVAYKYTSKRTDELSEQDGGFDLYEYEYDEDANIMTRYKYYSDANVESALEEITYYNYLPRGSKVDVNELLTDCEDKYGNIRDSGACGDNLTWTLYDSNILLIEGNGDMINFDYSSSFTGSIHIPWEKYQDTIYRAVLKEGITTVGNGAFYRCSKLSAVKLPDTLSTIGESAFQYCEHLLNSKIPANVLNIEKNAYRNCALLESFVFLGNKTTLNYGVLDDCTNLTDYELPETVKLRAIDEDASIFEFMNNTWIEKKDGSVLASTVNKDFTSIYAYGDGYYLLYKYETGFNANEAELTILTREGETIKNWNWSQNEDILTQLSRDVVSTNNQFYCGEAVFLLWGTNYGHRYSDGYLDAKYINCTTGNEFTIKHAYMGPVAGSSMMYGNDDVGSYLFKLSDNAPFDYVNYYDLESWTSSWKTYIVSSDGIVDDLGSNVSAMGDYSDGGFIFAWYDDGWHQDDIKLKFYDCKTGSITDICRDNDKLIKSDICNYKYLNGSATIHLRGADGNIYAAIVDKQGNYIQEPQAQ